MRFYFPLLILLSLISGNQSLASADLSQVAWQPLSERDGIKVFRWETADSPLFAFKGEAHIDASIAKVAQVLADTSRRKEWVPSLIEAKIIRQISEKERIEYTSIATPPFTANRDFVLHAKAEFVEATRDLIFHFSSVEDAGMPPTNMIRGRVINSRYVLRQESPTKTYLEYTVHVDPKGGVPRWLVNLVQKNIPRHTIEAIRRQVQKPDVEELVMVKQLYLPVAPPPAH